MKNEFVVVKTYFYPYEADIAKGLLEASDISCFISADDCGGMRPDITIGMGNFRLMVNINDLEKAKIVLTSNDDNVVSEKYSGRKRNMMSKSIILFLCVVLLLVFIFGSKQERGHVALESCQIVEQKPNKVEVCRELYKDGNVYSETYYQNKDVHGLSRFFYPNGSIKWEGSYVKNHLEGRSYEYFLNGKTHWSLNWRNGHLDGEIIEYYETGELKSKHNYKENLLNGPAVIFYKSGNIADKSNYEKHALIGENGELYDRTKKIFYESGELWYESTYKLGQLEGMVKEYTENGQIKSVKQYKNNFLNGLTREFSMSGAITEEIYYLNDEVKHVRVFDESGQLIFEAAYN